MMFQEIADLADWLNNRQCDLRVSQRKRDGEGTVFDVCITHYWKGPDGRRKAIIRVRKHHKVLLDALKRAIKDTEDQLYANSGYRPGPLDR